MGDSPGKSHASPFRRLRGWMEAERTDIWVVIIYSVFIGLLSLVVPIATQSLVNTIAFGTLLQPLLVLSVLVLLALVFSGVLRALRSHVAEVIQRRIFVRVSADSLERLLRVKISAYDDGHGPELVNRFFDVVTLQKGGATLLIEGGELLMTTLVGMLLLTIYHPLLMAFALILMVLVFVILFPLGRGAVRTAVYESRAKYSIAAWLQEIARHPATFKSAQGTEFALHRGNQLVASYLDHRKDHWRILLRQIAGSLLLQAAGSAAVLGAGGWLVMQQQLTLGQLVAAELVVAAVLNGFSKFGKQLETFYDLLAAVDKLGYLSDLPLENAGHDQIAAVGCAQIELRGVTFGFTPDNPVLQGINLEIPPKARVGILGVTSSGKSTLLDLIYGLREPTRGTLLFDGHDYRSLRLYDLRSQISIIRKSEIFHGTVEENLCMGNSQLSSADVRAILRRVGILEVVENLPEGLQTRLTTGGQPLNTGQSLRLMLARALALKPRVLILDEILDLLEDTPDRDLLLTGLSDPRNEWTLIISSRSPKVVSHCSLVLRIEEGRVLHGSD
ncbi:MAG TPA: ATP-binding cassette domain-containing protein [Bryobacteraceae bacterium]|nr:ATP-binding cassette domain-containing protein [Bryobacteraceae bacterium]